jgi:hypothetical protein
VGLTYKMRLGVPVLLAMVGAAAVLGAENEVIWATGLIGAGTIAMVVGDSLNAVLKGLGRPDLSAGLVGGLNGILLLTSAGALAAGWGLPGVGLCYLVSRGAYLGAAYLLARRLTPGVIFSFRAQVDRASLKDGVLHLPAVFLLGSLLSVSYAITYRIEGSVASAPWVLAYRAATAAFVLSGAGFEAVLPALSTVSQRTPKPSWGTTVGAYLAWGGVIAAALALCAPLAPSIFGQPFQTAVTPIRTAATAVPALVLAGASHTALLAAGCAHAAFRGAAAVLIAGGALGAAAGLLVGPAGTALAPAVASAIGGAWMILKLRSASPQGYGRS